MAQFDVFPHPVEAMRDDHPYVLVIQSSLIRSPDAYITIPLTRLAVDTPPMSRLNPRVQVGDEILVLDTLLISSFDPGELRRRVTNLQSEAQTIWDALDFALHGY